MREAVEQRGRHLGVAEDARPFAECEVGRDDHGGALVQAADQVKEELAAGLGERQIAKLVERDKVEPGQIVGEPRLRSRSIWRGPTHTLASSRPLLKPSRKVG